MATDNSDEVVFAVAGSTANPAERISLEEAGLREREHLQEWVIAHPEIIGPGVMIVTFEFDRWSSASGSQKDRLDVLGFGEDGRIVVAELKRGQAPDNGQLGRFGSTVKSRFKRSNPPYERAWSPDGTNQAAYRVGPELAEAWLKVRGGDLAIEAHDEATRAGVLDRATE